MPAPLFEVKDLRLQTDPKDESSTLFKELSFKVEAGDIVIIRGRSGGGKSTLLKALALLIPALNGGAILLHGNSPKPSEVPSYRTKVTYVPQRPSLLPGTPQDLITKITTFASRQRQPTFVQKLLGRKVELTEDEEDGDVLDPHEIAKEWGIPEELWYKEWSQLSGGEGQRIALAISLGRGGGLGKGGEIILLDEPTSALDPQSAEKVERTLVSMLPKCEANPDGQGSANGPGPKALVLITHSGEQADRLGEKGGRLINLDDLPR